MEGPLDADCQGENNEPLSAIFHNLGNIIIRQMTGLRVRKKKLRIGTLKKPQQVKKKRGDINFGKNKKIGKET